MSTKRVLLVVLTVSAVMLAVGVGQVVGSAQALPPAQESDPAGMTIPYPGRLDDGTGQAVADGAYDFTFALYDVETGGEPLWSKVQERVAVRGGAFNVLLGGANGIPMKALAGSERWLAVGVRGPGEAGFTALTPRQRLSASRPAAPISPASPSNGSSCPHTHWGETWSGAVAWGDGAFKVENSANGPSVWGVNTGGGNAVRGDGYGANAIGVYGEGDSGRGVVGQSENGVGVWGESTHVAGVFAHSGDGVGLSVTCDSGDIIRAFGASGSPDIEFKVENNGEVFADGTFHSGGADLADMVAVADEVAQYEPGDVLAIGPAGLLILAQTAYATNVAGVYSTAPGFVGGDGADQPTEGKIPLALVGVVPVKVSAENGPIAPGDLLVSSSTPGHAMRADDPPPGTILGKALDSLDEGTGTIMMLATLQ